MPRKKATVTSDIPDVTHDTPIPYEPPSITIPAPVIKHASFKASVGRMQLNGLPGGARIVTFVDGKYTTQDVAEIGVLRELATKGYVTELP